MLDSLYYILYVLRIMEKGIEKIISVLTKAESDLREQIVEAAKAGDYRTVDSARAAAVGIRSLRTGIVNPSSKAQAKGASVVSHRKRKSSSRKGIKSKYPKFEVKNDTLIRIGWSKKEHREYTHKTSRTAFDGTVKVMAALAQNGAGPFTAEEIIGQLSHLESEMIPSYQVYVVIGMLRKRGCIKQIGREGYNISTDITVKAKNEWKEFSNKND